MAEETVKIIKVEVTGIHEAQEQVLALNKALENTDDIIEKAELQASMDALNAGLEEANEQLKTTEGQLDVVSSLGERFAQLGEQALKFNVKGMKDQIDGIATASKNISFKGATASLKMLGSSFATLGKSLVTNPLMILSTVIGIIVVEIVKLMRELGVFDKLIQVLTLPLRTIIELFTKLTDAMGLTSVAAEKEAGKTAQAYEDAMNRIDRASNIALRALDRQIAVIRAQGGDTYKLEMDALVSAGISAGQKLKLAQDNLKKARRSSDREDTEEYKAMLAEREKEVEDYEQAILDIESNKTVLAQSRAKSDGDTFRKTQEDKVKANKQAADKIKQDEERLRKELLDIRRKLEDQDIAEIEDAYTRELKIATTAYERGVEDLNGKYKKDSELYKEHLKYLENEKTKAEEVAKDNEEKRVQEEKALRLQAQAEFANLMATELERRISVIDDSTTQEKDKFKKLLDAKLISQEQYDQAEEKLLKDNIEAKNKLSKEDLSINGSTPEEIKADYDKKLEAQKEFLDKEIINYKTYLENLAELEKNKTEAETKITEDSWNAKAKKAEEYGAVVMTGMNALGDMFSALSEKEIADAEGNAELQEQLRKKAFERNKKMQLGLAIMNGAQAMLSALAAPFPANIGLAIAAAAGTVANIAKIQSATYEGGGDRSASSPSAGSGSLGSVPTYSFGNSAITNPNGQPQNTPPASGQTPVILENTVVVSETAISGAQKTIMKLTDNATL